MSQLSPQDILASLRSVIDRETGRNVVEQQMVSGVVVRDGKVGFILTIEPQERTEKGYLREACEQAVRGLPGVAQVTAVLTAQSSDNDNLNPHQRGYINAQEREGGVAKNVKATWNLTPIEGIRQIIAVASGKGGVGKSTTAVNLALALQAQGKKVGLLDADIYGPSIPRMMGLKGQPEVREGRMQPLNSNGIACMSMGFIAGDDVAMVWRGPMLSKALHQMLRLVDWGQLDVLLIDMPPGTGDIHISMVQQVPLSGAIIVTTPQEVATMDAKRCLQMFRQVNVPILGVIENMSYFKDPATSHVSYIFGQGGGQKLAKEADVPFLGEVPLEMEIRLAMDEGKPQAIAAYENITKVI